MKDGLRIYSLAAALIAVAPDFFARHEVDAYAALAQISNASEVLPALLDQGRTTIAGRLAGAFEKIDRSRISDDIVQAMRAAGHEIRKSDPLMNPPIIPPPLDSAPPHVHRLLLLWSKMREPAISCFPQAPAAPVDVAAYLKSVEDTF